MKIVLSLLALILCTDLCHADYPGTLPATPAEVELVEYLKKVANIRFNDNLPVEPWIQCDDFELKRTFFSASLFQFSDKPNIEHKLQSWLTSFIDHAFWARVSNANCQYDINHFNECFSKGQIQVSFKERHVSYFHEFDSQTYCENN